MYVKHLSAVTGFLGQLRHQFNEVVKKVAAPAKYRVLYASSDSKSAAEHQSVAEAITETSNVVQSVIDNWLKNEAYKPLTLTLTLGEGKEMNSLVIALPAPERFLAMKAATSVQAVVEG